MRELLSASCVHLWKRLQQKVFYGETRVYPNCGR